MDNLKKKIKINSFPCPTPKIALCQVFFRMPTPRKAFTSVRCTGQLQGGFEKEQVYGDFGWVLFLTIVENSFLPKSFTNKQKSGKSTCSSDMCVLAI